MRRYLIWFPFLLVLLWCGKNAYYFGSFGTSSWAPLSQYKLTLYPLSQATRDSLYQAGRVSVFSTQEPMARLWRYGIPVATDSSWRKQMYPHTPSRFVPVLDISQFAENGSNMNHWLYLEVAKAQKADNKWAINHYPSVYWRSVWTAFTISLRPASTWFEVGSNHPQRQHNLNVMREAWDLSGR